MNQARLCCEGRDCPPPCRVADVSDLDVLIRRWRAGDERAAKAIYDQYWASSLGLAYSLLDDLADAEEAAQDALTYALTHIERYDPERARFSTWLHTITVSRCRNRRRRRFTPSLPLVTWLKGGGDASDPAPGPEHQAIPGPPPSADRRKTRPVPTPCS